MSQAKVDRYKEEKKNRKKIQKKQKAKQVVEILVCAAILGALGRHAYQKNYETRQANKTINASVYDYWAQQYWAANYTGYVFPTASNSDATPEDASATDAE